MNKKQSFQKLQVRTASLALLSSNHAVSRAASFAWR